MKTAVGRYPLAWFFVLSYALSWWTAPVMGGSLLPYGPAIAAAIVVSAGGGREALGRWWREFMRWRVGARWYLIAVGIIAGLSLVALVVALALGAEMSSGVAVAGLPLVILQLALLGGMWEEPGWSGYGLPTLQHRFANRPHGLLSASLAMAAGRAFWHLPLVLYGHIPWYDALFYSVALQFILTWLYNRTAGSVPVVMTAHLASNVIIGGILVKLFEGPDRTLFWVTVVVVAMILALVLNARSGWAMGTAGEEVSPLEPTPEPQT